MRASRGEVLALVTPPSTLHATDRDRRLAVGGDQDRGVHYPILLGALQFLSFEEQDTAVSVVAHEQVGHGPALADLLDRDRPGADRLVGEQVLDDLFRGWRE
jgi:hypothetical protein